MTVEILQIENTENIVCVKCKQKEENLFEILRMILSYVEHLEDITDKKTQSELRSIVKDYKVSVILSILLVMVLNNHMV